MIADEEGVGLVPACVITVILLNRCKLKKNNITSVSLVHGQYTWRKLGIKTRTVFFSYFSFGLKKA